MVAIAGATIAELVEPRTILEPMLARLAAERQEADRLADLRSTLEPPSMEHWSYLKNAHGFHIAIANSSGNRVLDLVSVALHEIFVERIHGALYPAEERERIHEDHAAIAAAIFSGDGQLAEALMRRHMDEFAKYVGQRHAALLEEVINWA